MKNLFYKFPFFFRFDRDKRECCQATVLIEFDSSRIVDRGINRGIPIFVGFVVGVDDIRTSILGVFKGEEGFAFNEHSFRRDRVEMNVLLKLRFV